MKEHQPSRQPGFTLVEMLVVIVIIGILAAFLLPAINAARRRAMEGRIAIEISNIEQAVEAYKLKYGDYPPNFSNRKLVERHILKAWPHITELSTFLQYVQNNPPDPAEAMVFWLGGFSSNPKRPFTGSGGPFTVQGDGSWDPNRDRTIGVFEFDKARLNWEDDGDAFAVYPPEGKTAPYIYFDSRTYRFLQNDGTVRYTYYGPWEEGPVVPYKSNRGNPSFSQNYPPDQKLEFAKPNTFQIVSAGLDDYYGTHEPIAFNDQEIPVFLNFVTNRPIPGESAGVNPDFHIEHLDNITNFTGGGTIEDAEE